LGGLFALAAGVLVVRSGVLPRLARMDGELVGVLLFLHDFTLGGVVANFGLALDAVGFVLLLIFVLVSKVMLLRRESSASEAGPEPQRQLRSRPERSTRGS
jgi:hypothetical protein